MKLPRCTNPEIDDYPPWLLRAVALELKRGFENPTLSDARAVLKSIDQAIEARDDRN